MDRKNPREGLQRKGFLTRNLNEVKSYIGEKTCSVKPDPKGHAQSFYQSLRILNLFRVISLFVAVFLCQTSFAQSMLSNTVSIHARNQPLHEVLTIIGNEANVTFSYNTKSIHRDSLVTVNAVNKPLKDVLRLIFSSGYEFKESGSYIIIRRKPVSLSGVVSQTKTATEYYYITGVVVDDETGEKIPDASIYEKQHLIYTLTDAKGNFTLKLKNKYPNAAISVSKTNYEDTAIDVQAKYNQKVSIAIHRREELHTNDLVMVDQSTSNSIDSVADSDNETEGYGIERKWIGRVLFSSKQRIQSLNLKKFYTTRAYQFSFVPGLSTHGRMNSQVISKTSINLIGGYSGGVDVMEIGGLFNLVKKDVKSLQLAGLFNIVGGKVKGVQAACLFNQVEENASGVQVGGLYNIVKKEMKGLQIATLFNRATTVKGMQIGFINMTDTNEGTSIGFINISKGRHGKHRVGFICRLPRKESITN